MLKVAKQILIASDFTMIAFSCLASPLRFHLNWIAMLRCSYRLDFIGYYTAIMLQWQLIHHSWFVGCMMNMYVHFSFI